MIAIIDYGSGNVDAVSKLLDLRKLEHVLTSDEKTLRAADRYILPGVGAFDPSMRTLRETGIVDLLNEEVLEKKKPVMGICVGMQLLSDGSDEGDEPGLGWIPGRVRRIDVPADMPPPHLPHMGWNAITLTQPRPIFDDIDTQRGFYFLHNYWFDAADASDVAATVDYAGRLTCAVIRNNVYGMQFHPEKSHSNGMKLFSNFARSPRVGAA